MPTLRGERFHIPLDDEEDVQSSVAAPEGFAATGVLGDILEREPVAPVAPTAPSAKTSKGWPAHRKRYDRKKEASTTTQASLQVGDTHNSSLARQRQDIDSENAQRIAAMTTDEIMQEQQELMSTFDAELLKSFLNRRKSPGHQNQGAPQSLVDPTLHTARAFETAAQSVAKSGSMQYPTQSPNLGSDPVQPSRPVISPGRKVSFSLPMAADDVSTPTALSHSVPRTPPAHDEPASVVECQQTSRPAQSTRNVSFSLPERSSILQKAQSASSHSIPTTSDNAEARAELTRRRSSSGERKVSFALPDPEVNLATSTAARHSISQVEGSKELASPNTASSRPPQTERRVSFATTFDDDDEDDDLRSTASHHSVPSTPQFSSEPSVGIVSENVHFPRPDQPGLDPESENFLEDLHQKYFPNLAHDPSKLDWMKPIDPRESAAYDPNISDDVHPKDIRFDFAGKIIPPSRSKLLPTNLGLHNHAAAPDAAGYTIAELSHLSRSSYAPQRCIAMQTLGRVLYRLGSGEFGREEHILRKDASGQRALLAKGLWAEVEQGHGIETISEEAKKERGHQTSIAIAQEALWNWQRGGGSSRARSAQ